MSAAAARRALTVGGGGVAEMAAARRRRRTGLFLYHMKGKFLEFSDTKNGYYYCYY